MFFIEDNDFLTDQQKYYINNKILRGSFPYYLQNNTVGPDGNKFFSHIFLAREEERGKPEKDGEYQFCSDHGPWAKSLFDQFCDKNNIKYERILRISNNITFKNTQDHCPIHTDHQFSHKQFILYLNEPKDKESKTVILDSTEKHILKEIYPEQFKGVAFEGTPHYYYFPKEDIRAIMIVTFVM
jgi:hypothetical protein